MYIGLRCARNGRVTGPRVALKAERPDSGEVAESDNVMPRSTFKQPIQAIPLHWRLSWLPGPFAHLRHGLVRSNILLLRPAERAFQNCKHQ